MRFGIGDVLVLLGVVLWALYTVLLRKRPPIAASTFLFLTFVIGAVMLAPLAAWEGVQGGSVRWSWRIVAAFAYVGVIPSVLAYYIYNVATEKVGAARAGQAVTLMPLFGALLSSALLGEALVGYHYAGMVLILAGIALSAWGLMRRNVRQKTPVARPPAHG